MLLMAVAATFFFSFPVQSETYYMRADGKAKSKKKAVSCSSSSTSLSVKRHNKEKFFPGDTICLCDDGGEYKSSIIVPSSGTKELPIIYKNAENDTPVIDLSVEIDRSLGWVHVKDGVYRIKGFARVFWEDDVPLKAASSEACRDGSWYYRLGSYKLHYRPTFGKPADHKINTMWFDPDWSPYGIDLRNKSHIELSGLNFNRCGAGIAHGQDVSHPVSPITNITLHHNILKRCMWAIWSQIADNGIESDISIYKNYIDSCNSGICAWTTSDTKPGHTQHHTKYRVTENQILNLYSLTDTKTWSDALLNSHYYDDHEGISFQDVQDSVIANNTITTSFVKDITSDRLRCRAIYLYLTNGNAPTMGNSILRNFISGHYYPSIYISTAKGHAGFENNLFAYNVIYYGQSEKGQVSFELNSFSDNPLSLTNYFVNNTIFNKSLGLGIWVHNQFNGKWVLRNNIVNSPSKMKISSTNDTGGMTIDHNIYNGKGRWGWQIHTAEMIFETWKDRTQYDSIGSKDAAPLFISEENDFRLRKGSPAINAGVSLRLLKDHAGLPLVDNPDIGAYEFQPKIMRGEDFRLENETE